jgi:hypothetical protein
LLSDEPDEKGPAREASVALMYAVTAVTIAIGLVMSVVPGLVQRTEAGAERFSNHSAYVARVLHDTPPALPHASGGLMAWTSSSIGYGIGTLALALATAAFGLWHARLPGAVRALGARALGGPVSVLRAGHSGIVGDYVLWIAAGTAIVGGIWAVTLT